MKPTNAPLLNSYRNGNVLVDIYADGTKVREWPDGEAPRVEFPESADVKITQYCDMDRICVFCFPPGTKITLPDGSKVNIEDVSVGMTVRAWNIDKDLKVDRKVARLFVRDYKADLVVISAEDKGDRTNRVLKLTPNHKVAVIQDDDSPVALRMVRADELKFGDILLTEDNTEAVIYRIGSQRHNGPVYNFEVEEVHTYFAGGLCVSNCHEQSNRQGKHGDLDVLAKIWESQPAGTEMAIGGGNPLAHPDLEKFLEKISAQGIIANVTVNMLHMRKFEAMIDRFQKKKLIYGLGISYRRESKLEALPTCIDYSNVVFHMIMGVHDLEDCEKVIAFCRSRNIQPKLLLLGYKQFGNGIGHYSPELQKVLDDWKLFYLRNLFENNGRITVSFDNLAIEQLDLQNQMKKEDFDTFYMGNDGASTCYFDAVTGVIARTSTSNTRFPISADRTVAQLFNLVKIDA